MAITDKSPHLAGAIRRKLPAEDFPQLELAFDLSLEAGGLEELDFTREPGVSYNPRPARVALILIRDAGITDSEIIAGGILACVWPEIKRVADLAKLPKTVCELARVAAEVKADEAFVKNEEQTGTQAATSGFLLIKLALQLDRARHYHLAAEPDWTSFIEETKRWTTLAEEISPPLHLLLNAWTERIERQLRMRRKNTE